MAVVKDVSSGDARRRWREILDTVSHDGTDVGILRYGARVAVLIPAGDYELIAEQLEELRLGRIAERAYEEFLAIRESAVPYDSVREELFGDDE